MSEAADWITAGSAALGLGLIWWQLRQATASLSIGTLSVVLEIEMQLNERKYRLDQVSAELRRMESTKADDHLVKIQSDELNGVRESYLNAFERLCYCILKGHFSERDWKSEYRDALRDVVKAYEPQLGPASPYNNIIKLNDKWRS